MTGRIWIGGASLVVIIACLFGPKLIAPAYGQQLTDPAARTIRVMGTGEIQVAPDRAHIDLAVQTVASTAQEAGEENARLMDQVIEALVGAGIPRDNIETRNYSLYPEYAPPPRPEQPGEEPRITGYRAINTVTAEVDDLERVGPLIDIALQAGANQLQSVRFSLQNPDGAQRQAMRRAVEEARESAETIADALGVALGPVLDASTTAEPFRPVPVMMRTQFESADAAAAPPTPIQPGEQTVTAQVTLVYQIGAVRSP